MGFSESFFRVVTPYPATGYDKRKKINREFPGIAIDACRVLAILVVSGERNAKHETPNTKAQNMTTAQQLETLVAATYTVTRVEEHADGACDVWAIFDETYGAEPLHLELAEDGTVTHWDFTVRGEYVCNLNVMTCESDFEKYVESLGS